MNIGIDIDGVLTNYTKYVIEEGIKYCKEHHIPYQLKADGYDSTEILGWDKKTDKEFWKQKIFDYATNNPVEENASNVIKKLKENNTIYIITARWLASPEEESNLMATEENCQKMRRIVKEWLSKNDIPYDHIIFSNSDKSVHILENNISFMIEDSATNVRELSKITKVVCFDRPYNKNIANENIHRCSNWQEIGDYLIANNQ